jgi:multidrug efflux pump subunit AcrA (membrane-fusion protein)
MKRTWIDICAFALLVIPLLAACSSATITQQAQSTPTPLPPAPELERPTYTVQRGTVERPLDVNGRVTPIDLVRLEFRRAGRVAKINVKQGDRVEAGDILAELEQADKLAALRVAEDGLAQAQRDLASAQEQHASAILQAELELREAQEDLARLLSGGADDTIHQAQRDLEQAQQAAETGRASASEEKTNAEHELLLKTEAVQDAQQAYSSAWWDNDWVEHHGTHPTEIETDPQTHQQRHRELTDREKQLFKTALITAERNLREAERNQALAQRTLEQKGQAEIVANHNLELDVQDRQTALDQLVHGQGNAALIAARRSLEQKRLALQQARQGTFNAALTAVESAQRELEDARREVLDGQVIAPQSGRVLALAIGEGDNAEAYSRVVEIADPTKLEVAAELTADQIHQLQQGQPAEISLLSRLDVSMPAVVRHLPAGIGAGGSGAVQGQDHTTRFTVNDAKGQQLTPGAVVKIHIVLERKENVLWLPPAAVRAFEGRRFVEVREGDRTHRAPVTIAIETEDKIEILEGLKEGDVIVGQ